MAREDEEPDQAKPPYIADKAGLAKALGHIAEPGHVGNPGLASTAGRHRKTKRARLPTRSQTMRSRRASLRRQSW